MGWAPALALIGTGVNYLGTRKAGKDAQRQGEAEAALREQQADDVIQQGTIEQAVYRRQLAKLMGRQRNEIGARNVELSGSALRLLEDSAQIGEEDVTTIRNNAAREAWGLRYGAGQARESGNALRKNANANAFGSLLTGAANAYGIWKTG